MDRKANAEARKQAQGLLEQELSAIVDVTDDSNRLYGGIVTPQDRGILTYRELVIRQLVHKAAGGDPKALQDVIDRTLGKTVQVNENLNVNATYSDFLSDLADLDEKDALPAVDADYTVSIEDPSDVLHPAPNAPTSLPPPVTIRPHTPKPNPAPESDLFD